ncbi:cell division protein FtsL, partial [Priestia megaterium]
MNNAAYKVREQDQQQKQQKTVRQVVRKTKRKITVGEKIV